MKSERLVAFETLYEVLQANAYSNIAVDKALKANEVSNKAFVSNLVYGVAERRLTLDELLQTYLTSRPKPKVKILLYMGVYQLYFMNSVPDSAAVNETVALADTVGVGYYKKFINAVLRKVSERRVDINSLSDSARYSCPQALINMWQKQYGEDATLQILQAMNEKPPVFAVPNTLYVSADELLYELMLDGIEGDVVGDLVKITSAFDLSHCKAFQNGLFHIEDASAYRCAVALGAQKNETVLDVCAAPGGKAFTIAERMQQTGRVYAFDLYEHRVALVNEGAERLGLNNLITGVNDAAVPNAKMPLADRVLCDVPCSGFGIIRRKPEIRYKDLDELKDLPATQYAILVTACTYLKTGGTLVYATCTLNKKENEKVVERFLGEHPQFQLNEMQTIFPSVDGGDGFFYAVMEKNDD